MPLVTQRDTQSFIMNSLNCCIWRWVSNSAINSHYRAGHHAWSLSRAFPTKRLWALKTTRECHLLQTTAAWGSGRCSGVREAPEADKEWWRWPRAAASPGGCAGNEEDAPTPPLLTSFSGKPARRGRCRGCSSRQNPPGPCNSREHPSSRDWERFTSQGHLLV